MPAFTKKTVKAIAASQNWNRSIDTIPDGQIAVGINIRTGQQGEIVSRPGLTDFTSLAGTPGYVHSMSRLNNYSANLPFFTYVYVAGADTKLFVGKVTADFTNAAINPVKLPPAGATTTLSGNPLTMVDAQPLGGVSGWKYVGDSSQMLAVGYYPGDTPGTNMARALTMGLLPPVFNPAITLGAGGLLNGSYQWVCVFRRAPTAAVSNPSAASRYTQATPAAALVNQSAQFTLPTTPTDPQTGLADTNVLVDVYRFGGTVFRWAYIGSGASGTSFTDNIPDLAVNNAPAPGQVTDSVTGLSRFNTFKPFPIPDIARYSTANATASQVAGGDGTNTIWILTAGGTDTFNTGLLQGSAISINNKLFTVYQVRSATVVEIAEDATGTLIDAGTYPWAIPAGQLVMGQPCPHIWGPYGIGSQGFVIFGCGAANAPGTLFWTNGNDPDSTDIANSLVVTAPSEPLRGGCVFNGVPYVWSTERMFRIYPQFGTQQFYTQEIGGGKGLWLEWSLNVQSNSIADQSITWRGKDGIYNYTEGGGVGSLTDTNLYPFFPHENTAGSGIGTHVGAGNGAGTIFPFLNSSFAIPPPDDTQPKYHRLTWFQGVLYYDYVGLVSNVNHYLTAVFDARQSGGWISFDLYFGPPTGPGNVGPISRSSEIAANNLKVAVAGEIYDFGGADDSGDAISCTLITKQDDCGDERGQKLYGDLMFDADPGGAAALVVTPLYDYGTSTAASVTTLTGAGRAQTTTELSSTGLGILSRTLGFKVTWTQAGAATTLYQYVFSYVPKPEVIGLRATDKTDDGYTGAKYLRGFIVEANSFNSARKVNILVDDVAVTNPLTNTAVFTINAADQLELPYAVTPVVGYEFQVAIDASDVSTAGWELFQVRWVYEKWPDLARQSSAVLAPGGGRLCYIRGFTLPLDTNGNPVGFQLNGDNGVNLGLGGVTTTGKTGVPYAITIPLLAREVQFVPNAVVRAWYDEIQWDLEPWPELTEEVSPWLSPVGGKPCHLRGFTMPVSTEAATVIFKAQLDDGTIVTINPVEDTPTVVNSSLKAPVGFYFSVPVVVHSIQLQPQAGCRCWYNEIVWDAEPWPELELEYSPWIAPKGGRRAYLRGFTMPVDTDGRIVPFHVQLASGAVVTPVTNPAATTAKQKTTMDFSFQPPVVTSFLRIQPSATSGVRCWFDEVTWDAEQYPELDTEYSPVLNCGTPRAKFLQGVVLPIDTQGAPVSFIFVGDSGVVGFVSAAISTSGKQPVAFSWTPFITHDIQIIPSAPVSIFYDEAVWIFEPEPELAVIWQTPMMTHGLSGYMHQRLFWIAYVATAAVVFTRVLSNGTVEMYNLPSTNGSYQKSLLPALPSKFLAASYQISSASPCRVYMQDCELLTKDWGSDGAFQSMKMIGSPSVTKGADI